MTPRTEQRFRVGLWLLLIVGWISAVWLMADTLTTLPASEGLGDSPLVGTPTGRTFFAAAAFSALELAVILAVLWPWRQDYYALRLSTAALALVTWSIMTAPLQLTRLDWVHRWWLVAMVVTIALALVLLLLSRGRALLLRRER